MRAPVALTILLVAACGHDDPSSTYYEREIEPILLQFCAGNVAGCHETNADDQYQFAAGNFDVTSFENVQKRRDVLEPHGAYREALLLIKAVGVTDELGVNYRGEFRPLQVQHAGGPVLQVGMGAYLDLLRWTDNGATENGLPPTPAPAEGEGDCAGELPAGFDPQPYLDHAEFDSFRDNVQPLLGSCSAGTCHGAPQADFYVSCGADDAQLAFNFSQVWAFVDDPVDNSQVLKMPLPVGEGGEFHTGGVHFPGGRADPNYVAMRTWAEAVGRLEFGEGDVGKEFFRDHVQPLLLTRGCSFEACHSPDATNDFKARAGSQGFFSAIAMERNYELLKKEFLAFEVPDVRRGRAVSKGILPMYGGIAHRGGPVLETPGSGGSEPSNCPATFDPDTASAYCIFQEWNDVERARMITAGEVLPLGTADTVPMVWVDRAASHVAGPLEFDTYQGGSDLRVADATIAADGSISVGASTSLLTGCAGVNTASADVRGPDISAGGDRVAFALRTGAADPLGIWLVDIDGGNCARLTPAAPDVSGMKIHNFDPAWSPDDAWIVFASTRGIGTTGPTRSRRLFLPQSDIWRMRVDGSGAEPMTYLTNSEISPQWMREGRVIMTTEKVSEGFYQLSGRRINWDRTDYHPLLAQRAQSPLGDPADPAVMMNSIGYQQATEIREAFNGNFLLVLSDAGVRGGAGTLAIFNRSVGPFELGRDDPGFLKSVTFPDSAATGRAGATAGAYRSPFPLLDGRIMASYSGFSGDLTTATSLDWDVVAVDARSGARQVLVGGAGQQVEAVLGIRYPARNFFLNRRQLVFGGGIDEVTTEGAGNAAIHMPDAPLLFTLFNANLRRGRPADRYRGAEQIAFYIEEPAPPGTTSGNTSSGIYQSRTSLGTVPLADDGSVRFRVPSQTGFIMELQGPTGNAVITMGEEHQLGPGEVISMGVTLDLYDAVCGGCHGSASGSELDIAVTPDALTGASESMSAQIAPLPPSN